MLKMQKILNYFLKEKTERKFLRLFQNLRLMYICEVFC